MPDHEKLGDVTPYILAQTDMIIQLGSTKDFVNRWVLENTLQQDDDESIEKLLKKQIGGNLNNGNLNNQLHNFWKLNKLDKRNYYACTRS
jgi:hypothetical protein